MATWVRNGTGTAPSRTDGNLVGTYELDNGTAPGDFDPAAVTSVQIAYTIAGSGFAGDTWVDNKRAALTLNGAGTELAQIDGTNSGPLGNTLGSNTDETDSAGIPTGNTTAEWEGAELNPAFDVAYTTWSQDKGKDGGVQTMSALVVTITYTPLVPYAGPVVETTATSQTTSASTSHTVSLPSSIAAGDLLLLCMAFDGVTTITVPQGWQIAREANNLTVDVTLGVFERIATGSEGASQAITTGASETGRFIAYRISGAGLDGGSAFTVENLSAGEPDPPDSAETGGTRDYLMIAVAATGAAATATAAPTNYSNLLSNVGTSEDVMTAEREIKASAGDNPGVFTTNTDQLWIAITFAFWDNPAEVRQLSFRFRDDDAGETDSAWLELLNTDTELTDDTQFRLRFLVRVLQNAVPSTTDYKLRVSKNSGAYADVTASSSNVRSVASGGTVSDGQATTEQLGTAGYDWDAGEVEAANGIVENSPINAITETEHEFVLELQAADLVPTDTLDFRLQVDVGGGYVDCDAYVETPRVTIIAGGDPLTGVLFSVGPTFPIGTVAPQAVTLTGVLFSVGPTFPVGTVQPEAANLTGVLFSVGPTFPVGTVTPGDVNLTGVLFSVGPTFPVGDVAPQPVTLTGVLFSVGPTFPVGTITSASPLDGVLFSVSPAFPTGTVAPGAVTLTGVLFSVSPTFPVGTAIPGEVNLTGVLFSVGPTFPVGVVTSTNDLTGVLFSISPVFANGAVTTITNLTGVLFSVGPTFPVGNAALGSGDQDLDGVLFSVGPTFPVGVVAKGVRPATAHIDFETDGYAARAGKSLGSGDYEAFFYLAPDDWSDGGTQMIFTQWGTGTANQAFRFALSATGQLQVLVMDSDGLTQRSWNTSAVGWANGVGRWIRLWFDSDAGGSLSNLVIYTSTLPPDRNPLEIDWGAAAYNPTDIVNLTRQTLAGQDIEIASYNGGSSSFFGGLVYYATFYDGFVADAGTQVVEFDVRNDGPSQSTFVDDGVDAVDWDLFDTWAYIDGVFRISPTFPVGSVDHVLSLTGVLFSVGPTFPVGTVAPGSVALTGVLFSVSPTFPVGQADLTLAGSLFSVGPVFPTGTVTAGSVTLTGILFSVGPTFPTGAVTPGDVSLTGVLFSVSPTFPTGTVTGAGSLDGVLFSVSPAFPVGTVAPQPVTLTGVLFSVSPVFPTGTITTAASVTGVLFSVGPVFPTGTVTSETTVTGALFSISPTFPVGTIANDAQVLTGVLFSVGPAFPDGAVTQVGGNLDGVLFSISPVFPVGAIFTCRTGGLGVTEVGIWEVGVDEECIPVTQSSFAFVAEFTMVAEGEVTFSPGPGHIGAVGVKVNPSTVTAKAGVGSTSVKRTAGSVTVVRSGGTTRPIKG